MDSYWAYAYSQNPCESTYEYFERYICYLDEYPYHGFQFHELITHFLDGMLPEECYMLRIMAGRPMMDCTPEELWCLIKEKAAATRPYMEYNSEQTIDETDYQETFMQTMYEVNMELAKVSKQIEEAANCICGPRNAPEPVQITVDDDEEPLLMKGQEDEDIVDDELQVEPMISIGDDLTKEWSSPPCADTIIEQNVVITCSTIIIPISSFSYHVQNDAIPKVVRNKQVWGSLTRIEMHTPKAWTLKPTLKSDKFLNNLCIKWKTSDKSKEMMRSSLRKSDIHSHGASRLRPTQRPMKLHPNWKKHKKGKCFNINPEFSMFSVHVQKNRSYFGWKPGWKLWENASHNVARNTRRRVSKYDGMHPWAPNIDRDA